MKSDKKSVFEKIQEKPQLVIIAVSVITNLAVIILIYLLWPELILW